MHIRRVMNGVEAVASVTALLRSIPTEPMHEVIIQEWAPPGSDKQLRTIYKWYSEIARDKPEDDANGWRRYCKYHIGVSILIKEQEHFEFFKALLSNFPMPAGYEKRLAAMEYVDVVSVMSREQRTEYMNGILKHPPFQDVKFTIPEKKQHGSSHGRTATPRA